MASVPSVEPSSTSTNWKCLCVCASSESSASDKYWARLRSVTPMPTSGVACVPREASSALRFERAGEVTIPRVVDTAGPSRLVDADGTVPLGGFEVTGPEDRHLTQVVAS